MYAMLPAAVQLRACVVRSNPMCVFAYDELGRGSGLSELYQRPEVADLLLCLAKSAAGCPAEVGLVEPSMFRVLGQL